ncbi:uncharacterized protein B0H18DRAFT_974885 [Fomitopsis serialis]|uniref:uncharacterized protein n=1 Tax=Fomitopsis serialis TaxID=139415 RepID=UPI002007C2B6|nr:uncharacterized protein B0H18DRAFT_974885 [Neoantrodia serialis]KAH9936652.1 hypothetical protein B0H18DRAFT_974885 [Neoantrodia serialis]
MSSGQTYGKELPDQVDRLVALTDVQLELLADVREMHKERVALEREYATKLQALARKAAEKKSKKDAALVVGTEPTKTWGEDVLQRSTLHNAYAQLISSMMDSAQAHNGLADSLTAQVIEALKVTERRQEEAKKKQEQHFSKLLSERDRVYTDRIKSKQKYDEDCSEVESYRQKQGRADDRHADRAAKQFESQQVDMQNSKNVYLISTSTSNRLKDKFYDEDLPSLEDQFQTLQAQLLERFVVIMVQAQSLQKSHLDTLRTHIDGVESRLAAVNPQADQELFIEHNIRPFTKPGDWSFEPCTVHYDTADMVVEPAPKVYLQNRLTKCRSKLDELRPVITSKRKEMESFARMMANNVGIDKAANREEATDSYLEAHHQLTFYLSSEYMLLAEIDVISAALSGDEGEQKLHAFKSTSFSIPTPCAYCKSSIWGLSKQGKTCKACGISVHAKCELKVPADCAGSKGAVRSSAASTMSRSSTMSSTTSKSGSQGMTPSPSSFAPRDSVIREALPSAQVVYSFTPTSPFELVVTAGTTVQVLEEDDGSGWVKVADELGGKGLVPAAYVQVIESSSSSATPRPPPVPPATSRPQVKGKSVRGVYAYQSQGPDELNVQEGGLIELTGGPRGGMNYADGWWEGVDSAGRKGIFPSNYVELAQ